MKRSATALDYALYAPGMSPEQRLAAVEHAIADERIAAKMRWAAALESARKQWPASSKPSS